MMQVGMKTHVTRTPLDGLLVIHIDHFKDERGFFLESWNKRSFAEAGILDDFVQDSHSASGYGVLRGLHYQDMNAPMAKLVRCTMGRIYDVIIDLRSGSSTYKQWLAVELAAENRRMLYIPEGFAHGFLTLDDNSEIFYQMSEFYAPACARGVRWNDPAFGIEWPMEASVISNQDRNYPDFRA